MPNILQEKKWTDLPIKDKVSYITAFVMIASGIIIAFLSFFLNAFNIASGVLLYIAQTFLVGGSLIGTSIYFKSKWMEFDSRITKELDKVKGDSQ